MASQISAIDKQSIHKLCSGQVVLDLATAVKELVENSIDAGATSVEIRFKDHGTTSVEVIDDGSGIDPADYEALALKHYTSKLVEFTDLERVQTFGFRGEALSSLCALSQVTITTATKAQQPMGVKLEYDMNGVLVSQTPSPRPVGTTVTIADIFHSLPVRQREFKRNIKREYGNALTILQAYSIISTNVRISVSNQAIQKQSIKVMSTSGNKELVTNIANVFGAKLASQVIPFKIDLSSVVGNGSVEGFISKPEWGIGRSSTDRQYYYVNGRPCTLPKIARTLNEVYRTFISKQYPVVIADFKIPTDGYEVNLSPDKRTIILHQEPKIVETITEQLKEQLEPSRSVFELNPLSTIVKPVEQEERSEAFSSSTATASTSNMDVDKNISSDRDDTRNDSRTSPSAVTISLDTLRSNFGTRTSTSSNYTTIKPTSSGSNENMISDWRSLGMNEGNQFRPKASSSGLKRTAPMSGTSSLLNYMSKKPKPDRIINELPDDASDEDMAEVTTGIQRKEVRKRAIIVDDSTHDDGDDEENGVPVDTPEYIEQSLGVRSFGRFRNTKNYVLTAPSIDINSLQRNLTPPSPTDAERAKAIDLSTLENASFKNVTNDKKAAEALSRVISKPDFARMRVLGQFNLGFIITNLDEHDLYIVDQHAADEKYNFETLQQTTHLTTQKLIRPQVLDLTAAEELIVIDNLEIFEANGFGVEILQDNEPTKRVKLVSHATSKNTVFDKHDFTELVSLINESPGKLVHCSRIRAMFASRACHKAARIGDSLSKRQMTSIVHHMGEIEQPWNCPHGRPTMRHLLSFDHFKRAHPSPVKKNLTFKGSLFTNNK